MPPKSSKKRSHSPAPPTSAEDASSTTTQPKEPKRRKVTQDADDDEAVPKGVDAEKIIKFLLSDEALRLLSKMDQGAKGDFRFPRDRLNAFQDLVAAEMISKPFSHVLGTRAINELFSKEHGKLDTPQALLDYGREKILEGLWKSKTLHKDKTATQLIGLAETTLSTFNNSGTLDSLRSQASHSPSDERTLLIKTFNGYGPKTVDIFFRRVQVDWEEVYPFADKATMAAARRIGLEVEDAEGLRRVVDGVIEGEGVGEREKREKFGRVVDVLVYMGLEGQIRKAREMASKL